MTAGEQIRCQVAQVPVPAGAADKGGQLLYAAPAAGEAIGADGLGIAPTLSSSLCSGCLWVRNSFTSQRGYMFHLAVLCESLRCGAYGTFCYGIS